MATFVYRNPEFAGRSESPNIGSTKIPPPAAAEQADDGLMRIKGSGAQIISLSHSLSDSYSRQVVMETKRTYDEVRIMNPDDNSQYIDVQRPYKTNMQMRNNKGDPFDKEFWSPVYVTTVYSKQPKQDNVEVINENVSVKNPDYKGSGTFPRPGGGFTPP